MIPLTQVEANQKVHIVEIQGGDQFLRRLENMGIRHRAVLTKVSERSYSGPVIVKSGHTQVALGRGMAEKIIVELPKPSPGT